MNCRLLPFISILAMTAVDPLQAASVSVPALQTGGQPSANGLEIHSSVEHSVDLSSKSGLAPGQNILVTLAASEAPIHYSSFQPTGGAFSYNVTETLSLIIGGNTFFSSVVISFVAADVTTPPGTSHIVGFRMGDLFDTVAVSVPWNTDLSALTVRLSQDGTISGGCFSGDNSTGVDGLIVGGTRLRNLSMQLTSVPEPGTFLFLCMGCMGLALRRRRVIPWWSASLQSELSSEAARKMSQQGAADVSGERKCTPGNSFQTFFPGAADMPGLL